MSFILLFDNEMLCEQMLSIESTETWIKRFEAIASTARQAFTLEFLKFTIFMKVI